MEVSELHLVVPTTELRLSNSGTVLGRIFVQIGSQAFPGASWTDFAAPVTTAWLDACIDLARRTSDRERVRFMDGPFYVELSRGDRGITGVEFVEDRGVSVVQRGAVRLNQILADALSTARNLASACDAAKWDHNDRRSLLKAINSAARLRIPLV